MAKIVRNPAILGGKPIIDGTRISVELVLDLLASGASRDEIIDSYPHLNSAQINACISYARELLPSAQFHSAAE